MFFKKIRLESRTVANEIRRLGSVIATSTKKDGFSPSFFVEVARVELASKQGARRLSTRLVVT